MKPFLPPRSITKFLLTTPKAQSATPSLHILHFSTTPNAIPWYSSRRHEEESRSVRVSVWWDFENCSLPNNVNVFKVSQFITGAVRASGIKGPLTITAFGDISQLSRPNQEALSATGINLTHIPNGGKNSADRSLLLDLMYWVSQNPPPAHLFLISSDRDFASVLHRLRMKNYNILLASSDSAPGVLCSSASIMWQWSSLVRGENLTGKYFNQPPDGPYASWYGHYNAPLEDPFAVVGQPSNVKAVEVSEGGSDILRPIPKIVMEQIRNILNSYPKGVSTVDLRTELGKSNVSIDKDYFGYRKFSRLLLAMPQILKMRPDAGGQYLVHSIPTKICGENDSTTRSSVGPLATKDEGRSSSDAAKQNVQKSYSKDSAEINPLQRSVSEPKVSGAPTKPLGTTQVHELPKPYTEGVSEKLSPPLSQAKIVGAPKMQDSRKSQQPSENARKTASVVKEADKTEVTSNKSLATFDRTSVSAPRVFEKFLEWWFGPENSACNVKGSTVVNKASESAMHTKEKKETKVSAHGTGPAKGADNLETTVHSAQSSSLFTKITSWFRSWRNLEESDDGSSKKSQKPDSSSHRLFSKGSFWNDMKSLLVTPKGSSLVLQAKTRSQLGQALQKDGPQALQSLSDKDLGQLVDMLITDKKWVEESAFLSSPFKLAEIAPKDSHDGDACSSDVLSSVVSVLQSGSLKRDQLIEGKKCQNLPHAGVTQPARQKLGGKSKSEMLADCKNLVQFIVKEHPEGYNLGLFRKLFLERFGYPLELQKLGYHELATLLQTIPGVRVESAYIVPSGKSIHASGREDLVEPSDKLSDEPQKDEGNESPWEELGPLSDAVSDGKPTNSKKKVTEKMKGQARHHYELLSEDYFSDSSEDETTLSANIENREQRKGSKGNSPLLNILDNWYDNKVSGTRKSNSDIVDSSDEYIEDGTSDACRSGKSSETDISSYGRRKRHAKSYSFVADQPVDEKDKVVGGILTSLKKS
ncbi:hypothetical protein Leryth_011074 [Lithospermum erythrorhizon]|nr:hypothetical protein Leryth_011074 [Lithospermum erythrorhizon]